MPTFLVMMLMMSADAHDVRFGPRVGREQAWLMTLSRDDGDDADDVRFCRPRGGNGGG